MTSSDTFIYICDVIISRDVLKPIFYYKDYCIGLSGSSMIGAVSFGSTYFLLEYFG